MEIKDKKYIQFPKFRIDAGFEPAVEEMNTYINLPENRGRFKDGEGIVINYIGEDGGRLMALCLVSVRLHDPLAPGAAVRRP